MADALPVLIAYVGADGRYQFSNAGYEHWLGLPRDACNGRHMRDVLGEAAYATLKEHVEAALAGQPLRLRGRGPLPDGWYAGRSGQLRTPPERRGQGSRLLQTHRRPHRATECRGVRAEPRRRLRAILNTAADAIITINYEGIIQSVNPGDRSDVRLHQRGLDRAERENAHARTVPGRARRVFGQLSANGRTTHHRHRPGGHGPGARTAASFPVDLAVSEIDELKLFAGIIRDITRRKELEREVVETVSLEQRRIGQDLHDSVGQELTALNMRADELAEILRTDSTDAAKLVEQMVQGLQALPP